MVLRGRFSLLCPIKIRETPVIEDQVVVRAFLRPFFVGGSVRERDRRFAGSSGGAAFDVAAFGLRAVVGTGELDPLDDGVIHLLFPAVWRDGCGLLTATGQQRDQNKGRSE